MLHAAMQRRLSGSEYAALRDARVKAFDVGGRLHLRLRGFSPSMMFIGTLCTAMFVLGLAYPLATMVNGGAPVPQPLIAAALSAALALAAYAAWHRSVTTRAGRYDYRPEPGSPEAELYTHYLGGRDWLDTRDGD